MVPPVSTFVVPSDHGHDDDALRTSRSFLQALADHTHSPKQDNAAVYIHPLVKKSSEKLSEKSLEMCTESLGSETGSDIMEEPVINSLVVHRKEKKIAGKTKREYSFPPPLTSINSSVGMEFHRENGRLVMNAVVFIKSSGSSIFHAERVDGRLTLRLKKDQGREEGVKSEDTKFETQDTTNTNGGGGGEKRDSNEIIENMEGNIGIDENIARVGRCNEGGGGGRREGHMWNMETCWVAI